MTTESSSPAPDAGTEHRGWRLEASWCRASLSLAEGWVCFATRPDGSHRLNIGRWSNSELALEHGRAYVDRWIDKPGASGATQPVLKRRR